jgi:hypothetical protein
MRKGSSVSIVSGYELDDQAIEVRSPDQTNSGDHPAYCTMGTGVPFPEAKARPRHDTDRSSLSSAEVKNEDLYFLPPQLPSWCAAGQLQL